MPYAVSGGGLSAPSLLRLPVHIQHSPSVYPTAGPDPPAEDRPSSIKQTISSSNMGIVSSFSCLALIYFPIIPASVSDYLIYLLEKLLACAVPHLLEINLIPIQCYYIY